LLELLREGPKSTGELAKAMPSLTRFAVMQHLGVLEEAGLLLSRREGRQRLNYSNPLAVKQLFDTWVTPLASHAAETAQHMRRYAELKHEAYERMNEQDYRLVQIELETVIQAPVDIVFDALTKNYPEWFPHRFREGGQLYHDNCLGGTLGEKWSDGGGVAYGTVMWLQPNAKVVTVGIGLFGDYTSTQTETVEPAQGGGTVYKKRLHLWGKVTPELEKMLTEGSQALANANLKSYCEAKANS
jgi:DNA-binding transcriptional ArsR family regulator/uncharacterized protein YndB with AHSA1/START domain